MADTVIGEGSSRSGTESCGWAIDYDSVAHTVGIVATGQASRLIVSVTITSTGKEYFLDCINGSAGNILNVGRVILGGPGSVIGQTAPIVGLPVPPFGKGVAGPYTFDTSWNP